MYVMYIIVQSETKYNYNIQKYIRKFNNIVHGTIQYNINAYYFNADQLLVYDFLFVTLNKLVIGKFSIFINY